MPTQLEDEQVSVRARTAVQMPSTSLQIRALGKSHVCMSESNPCLQAGLKTSVHHLRSRQALDIEFAVHLWCELVADVISQYPACMQADVVIDMCFLCAIAAAYATIFRMDSTT